jgi:hypothetical protein
MCNILQRLLRLRFLHPIKIKNLLPLFLRLLLAGFSSGVQEGCGALWVA